MEPSHEVHPVMGCRCPCGRQAIRRALEILGRCFGRRNAVDLLWAETCFPADAITTLEQAMALVGKERRRRAKR